MMTMDDDKEIAEYEELALDADLEPIANDVARAARAYDKRMFHGDDKHMWGTAAIALEELALANRLCEALAGRADQLFAIDEVKEVPATDWLTNVPFDLAEHKHVDEAAALGEKLARVLEQPVLLGDRAHILARAGRTEEARAAVVALVGAHPDDDEVLDRAADVFSALGDDESAERETRRAIELTSDPFVQLCAKERLSELLRKRGADDEAEEIEEELRSMDEELDEAANPSIPPPTSTKTAIAKVGRNDPCPCGSGKKYKKCHAETAPKP